MGVVRKSLLEKKAEFEKWLERSGEARKRIEKELKEFDERVAEAKETIKEIDELLGGQKRVVVNVNSDNSRLAEDISRAISNNFRKLGSDDASL